MDHCGCQAGSCTIWYLQYIQDTFGTIERTEAQLLCNLGEQDKEGFTISYCRNLLEVRERKEEQLSKGSCLVKVRKLIK